MKDTKGTIRGECNKCKNFCIEYNKNAVVVFSIDNLDDYLKKDICALCGCSASDHKEYFFLTTRDIKAYEMTKEIYNDYIMDDTFQISIEDTKEMKLSRKSFTYGEISLLSFPQLLAKANPKKNEVFYDLGCGSGKPVVYASFLYCFKKCIGIELLPLIFDIGKKYINKCKEFTKCESEFPEIEIIQGDILKIDFSDADIIYLPSTTFSKPMMKEISRRCEKLKIGTRIISLSKAVPCITEDDCNVILNVYHKEKFLMSWGPELVYYQEKL